MLSDVLRGQTFVVENATDAMIVRRLLDALNVARNARIRINHSVIAIRPEGDDASVRIELSLGTSRQPKALQD